MKNIATSLKLCLLAYLIANIIGFAAYYIHVNVMWIAMFTLNPIVFGFFFYACLKKNGCTRENAGNITNRIALQWIGFSFLLDALVYMLIMPCVLQHKPNPGFFMEQSPWIWLNYMVMFVLGHISRLIYLKNYRYI